MQRITWQDYAAQGKGLLDHLGIARAHVAGGCAGCSVVTEFAVRYPGATAALVLLSPAGGARYRIRQQERFTRHLAYVAEHGLAGVAELARSSGQAFGQDPRVGPWGTVVARDESFAVAYTARDQRLYEATVAAMARTLFDRDTVPGPEPEDLMGLALPALIVPGQDASHAPSAARYLQECLPGAQYWDVPVSAQDEVTLPAQVLEFLELGQRRLSGQLGLSRSPRSRAAICSSLRACTPPLNGVSSQACVIIAARSGATILAPMTSTFASLWARAICVVNKSWQTPARMPRILLQAICSPEPEPPMTMPRSAAPLATW